MTLLLDTNEKNKIKSEIVDYIDKHCLFRADPSVVYSETLDKPGLLHGRHTYKTFTHQYMMRRLTHNPDMLQKAVVYIFDDILISLKDGNEYPQFQFAGLESGSLPLIAALQMYAKGLGLSINAFTVRKERKEYGIFNFVEGIPDSMPVMYIDDLVNSGSSIRNVADVASYEYGLTSCKNSYTILKYRDPFSTVVENASTNEISEYPEKLNSICDTSEFLTEYDADKYWLPEDCNKAVNKRPEYR